MAKPLKTDSKRCGYDEDAEVSSEWECAICKGPHTQPKLLPCSHTFCQECLEGIVRNQPDYDRRSFLCPVCRERIRLPPNGVPGFKNNVYIIKDEPSSKRTKPSEDDSEKVLCENHPPQERRGIELYCLQCSVFLCWKCKSTHHMDHVTEEVEKTAERGKVNVAQMKDKLKVDIGQMKVIVDRHRKEHKVIREKREAIRKEIESRYRMLSDLVDRCREDAMFSLDTATASVESELPLNDIEKTMDDLERLHKRMDMCISCGDASRVVMSAVTIQKDVESKAATVLKVHESSIEAEKRISRPMLRYTASADTAAQACRNYLGNVTRMDMQAVPSAMKVKEKFRSEKGKKYDIFSFLPTSTVVCVAYDTNSAQEPAQIHPERLKHTGVLEPWRRPPAAKGPTSITISAKGKICIITQAAGKFLSYAKSRRQCLLSNNLTGSAVVTKIADAQDPVDSRLQNLNLGNDSAETQLAVIPCGPHRSFDIHATDLIIAIVEEDPRPATSRSVVLFVNGQRGAYGSPIQPYLPSDVCFYKLHGRDVLLVADELNDTVHVVDVQTGHFLQFLAPGCPLVIQPTALGVDISNGQLWVACRGGTLLVCEP